MQRRRIQSLRFSRWRWHPDEVVVKINGKTHHLWPAVDDEGELLEAVVAQTRDRTAALRFLKKLLRRRGRPTP
ncbi:hypothetical protein GCM10011392_27830 [Wenxinia marina]|nr:hypothetical protein GCM10011392_27830 [Wenxinia marina]